MLILPTFANTLEPYRVIGDPLQPRAPQVPLTRTASHFVMPAGFQPSREIAHYAEVFRLADAARLLARPDIAEARMKTLLALHGIEQE